MRINTNINSMRTQEYMRQNQDKMNVSMNRLSSGKRINSAADDAAGLAIATRMRAKENGLGVASRNTQDGISMIRTADSAMNSVSNILLRMRDLAVQSANGTNTNENRGALQKEFTALKDQIDYISTNTQFNGKTLLNGDNPSIKIHSYDDGQAATAANTSANSGTTNPGTTNPGTTNPGTTNPAINGTINITLANVTSANLEGNEKKLSQISISATNAGTTGTAAAPAATEDDSTAIKNANDAIKAIDGMIASIAGSRADLGATLNRLDFNVESLNNQASNMASSASQIEDADMAKEMSEMTKFKILNEAGISMLSQANQTPQMVSKLLQ
ncbi:flagellin [Bacillus cereus VDM053]|nr:flagellin [Bacillus cereus VDM053]